MCKRMLQILSHLHVNSQFFLGGGGVLLSLKIVNQDLVLPSLNISHAENLIESLDRYRYQ